MSQDLTSHRCASTRAWVIAIGSLAAKALKRSGGRIAPLPGFPDAPYYEADGEILWVGAQLAALHPRAVVTARPLDRNVVPRFDALPSCWTPCLPRLSAAALPALVDAAERLRQTISKAEPRGLGELLRGRTPAFPLDLLSSQVSRLANAFARGSAETVFEASAPLIGVGPGLTPSGDDFVGAALFGRRCLAGEDRSWTDVGERLAQLASRRSHPVSAALFGDLVGGQSFAPLHEIAHALAAGDDASTVKASRRLVEIGNSSGWDMLAGMLTGMTGRL